MSKYIDADKVISEIQRLHDAHSGNHGCDEVGLNLEYLGDFITTLLSKQEQPVEWSEDDDILYESTIWCIEQAQKFEPDKWATSNYDIAFNWIKDVRKRLKSRGSSWKPSEEQMESLNKVVNGEVLLTTQHKNLESLYADLQKLL